MNFDFLKKLFRKNEIQSNPPETNLKTNSNFKLTSENSSKSIQTFERIRPYSFAVQIQEPVEISDNELDYFGNLTLEQHFERLKKAQKQREANNEHYRLVVVDLETTGQSIDWNEILQIAIIDEKGNKLLNQYCKPKRVKEWERSIAIHGISPILVENCPHFSDVKPYIIDVLSRADKIIAYDRDVSDYFEKYKIDFQVSTRVGCGYREHYNIETGSREKWIKLEDAASCLWGYYDCGDSLEDARAILKIYNFLLEQNAAYNSEREKRNQDKAAKNSWKQNKDANPSHPLYGKKIAFADELPISREEAFKRSADVGAIPRSSLSPTVNILVCGTRSKMWAYRYGEVSAEENKARKLNNEGASIKFMLSSEFMELLNYPVGEPEKVSTVDT